MKLSTVSAVIGLSAILALAGSQAVWAHCWEFGLRVKNASGAWFATPIEIWLPGCSPSLVAIGSSTSSPGSDTVNFRIDSSLAARTVFNNQTVTVTATVNGTLSKSIVIGGLLPIAGPTPTVTSTWGGIKALYRD